MKNNYLVLILMINFASLINGQTLVPDDNFEAYLETHDANGNLVPLGDVNSLGDGNINNDNVPTSKILNVINLNISNRGILALTGIEDFVSLETLICNGNKLTFLDVSTNINLKTLLIGLNQLSILDITSNVALEVLDISDNQISVLNILSNTSLKRLTCSDNRLGVLDISQNSSLEFLAVTNNQLTNLNINNNTNLTSLFCASNQITNLNLLANTVLKNLDASDNLITSLDLSKFNSQTCPNPQTNPATLCQGPATINISKNQLSSLTMNNGFNNLISTFNSEDNPDLFCIQTDSGFTPPLNWVKDDWTYYSENLCADIYTYVPDDNFEAYLEANGFGDNIADNNFVLTSNINVLTDLPISGLSLSDLTGVEDFLALTNLDCSSNNLKSLDIKNNVALEILNCSNNNLPTIDVSNNTALVNLNCSSQTPFVDVQDPSNNYSFNTLNLSSNSALQSLNCSNNSIVNLDLSVNNLLNAIDCSFNQISNLNLVSNTLLSTLLCNDNLLLTLNVKNGTNVSTLATFNAENNPDLLCIEVDNVAFSQNNAGWLEDDSNNYNVNCGTFVPDNAFEAYLEANGLGDGIPNNNFVTTTSVNAFSGPLNISGLSIADLTGIQDFLVLQNLNCSNNLLIDLDLSNNTALTVVNCSTNQIQQLDFSLNTSLTTLLCNDNDLLSLNINNGNNNNITSLDSRNNSSLFCINTDAFIVGTNPAGWQKDAIANYNDDCQNNRLTSIPDPFFEQALIDLGLDDVIDSFVLTANIEHLLNLDVNDKGIIDLTGIRDFTLLQNLDCSNNFLSRLDVSGMINLKQLNCNSNYFLTTDAINPVLDGLLNITGTANLVKLLCSSNNLEDLDLALNANLEVLECFDNNLSALDINNNLQLKVLNASNNSLANLDFSNNTLLEEINCNSNQINNLTGFAFTNSTLQFLSINNNQLSELLTKNYLSLKTLYCSSNTISELLLNANLSLENLDFSNNIISTIDLTANVSLISLLGSQNQLTQIDLNTNLYSFLETLNLNNNQIGILNLQTPNIKALFCASNQLTNLDLSTNLNLIELNISSNQLTNLTLSDNLGLIKTFNASNNQLTGGIDLSNMGTAACPAPNSNNPQDFCPNNILINVSGNQFKFVNIQNGINGQISNFNATNNPELSCIQVDDANSISANWLKDAAAQYSLDCRFGETYVPDDNFESALIALNLDSGPLDDYVLTANIEGLLNLNISGNNISDLTGIEDFKGLQNLNCSNNNLSIIDLRKNVNLSGFNCSNNTLSVIDLGTNIALTSFDCSNNTLSNIDLTANISLSNLNIANNTFSVFNPSTIPSLQIFNCDSNLLIDLDFQSNIALTSLTCQFNNLEKLNVKNGQNQNLANFNSQSNLSLNCIETDTGVIPGGVTWLKDATANYAINCFYGQTFVPDDAFEQALISLGFDTGVLDDYVLTRNIENISFLNISNKGISNLTGIEAFISLTNLNFNGNTLSSVDLSDNILLRNLNASNNNLTNLDITNNTNLILLDASNNNLMQLNLDLNINLKELNISNNVITAIDIASLNNLEILDCSSNQLTDFDATLNPNLLELYCQSNLFVSDQLNIQNGNNQNLKIFNASNNPMLSCILVDDPFTVITNNGGVYDGWFKDVAANYQTICEDADNDGVANADDQCPGTPFGDKVDLFGCTILNLPNNNFTVLITSETCLNNNDGKINIKTLEYYNYTATITKEGFSKEYRFTNEIDILNLLAGTYKMCITIEEWPDYINCYDVVINQPEPLGVLTNKNQSGKVVSLNMTGGSNYNIEFNGLKFNTSKSKITLTLQEGKNSLKVTTDIECQGTYEKAILMSDKMFVYPNPFQEKVNLYLGDTSSESITINMYSYLGQLVFSNTLINQKNYEVEIETSSLTEGIYTVSVQTANSFSTFKIIKK